MAMALRATAAWFVGVITEAGSKDSCLDFPGNHSGSIHLEKQFANSLAFWVPTSSLLHLGRHVL